MDKSLNHSLDLLQIYKVFLNTYGHQHWWPVFGAKKNAQFEISVGAVLTQNTSWINVEKAIKNLLAYKIMSPQAILDCPPARLKKLLRPAGYYNQKAKKLRLFSRWLRNEYGGKLEKLFALPLAKSRTELLAQWGIGFETADSILLYAGHKPTFVIDTYTKRFLAQHDICFKTYQEYQNYFHTRLPPSTKLFNEFHALIVAWGKNVKSTHHKRQITQKLHNTQYTTQ